MTAVSKNAYFDVLDDIDSNEGYTQLDEGYTQNWSEEVFVVSKIKDTVLWTYMISDLNGEKIAGSF